MNPIHEHFAHLIEDLMANSKTPAKITPENVYQPGNKKNRPPIDGMVAELLLEGSQLEGEENFKQFLEYAKAGKSCLLLPEHYSNFDIPTLCYMLEQAGNWGHDFSEAMIFIAGMKLNEDNPMVRAFTEAYSRIVIYPSRSLASIKEKEEMAAELKRSAAINRAALHEMVRAKHHGHIILMFPAGTRYRPGDESTKKGVKEVDSYIKTFDYIMPVAIKGNLLRINEEGGMHEDIPTQDKVIIKAGEIREARKYRNEMRDKCPEGEDSKQFVADSVMTLLEELHNSI